MQPIKITNRTGITEQTQKKHNPKQHSQKTFPPRLVAEGSTDHNPPVKYSRKLNRINIATLNTRTLRTQDTLAELNMAIQDIKWDILGISEMRREGENIHEYQDYILFNKGEKGSKRGVGFLIKMSLKKQIQSIFGISDRIAVLNINLSNYTKTWTIIQAYAPTEQAAESEIESFYADLAKAIRNYTNNHIILMGDFNAQIGEKQYEEEYVLGKHGLGKRSPNGQRLVEFLLEHNLTLLNSVFKKNTKNKWTWISPDGRYKNEIDYITSNFPKAFSNTSVISKLNFNTDHRMVRSTIVAEPPKKARKYTTTYSPTQISTETFQVIGQSITNNLQELTYENEDDIIANYRKLEKQLTTTININKSKSKYPLSNETIQLIKRRKLLLDQGKNKENMQLITEISKQINKYIRRDRKNKRLEVLERQIIRTGGVRKALKELRETGKEWMPKLRKKEDIITNRKGIHELATEFYKELYSNKDACKHHITQPSKSKVTNSLPEQEPDILESEVEKAIKSQKMEKAPGPDKITNEMLRGTMDELVPILTKMFNRILKSGYIPTQWETSYIILLYKKGAKDDIGNYRPISLMSNMYKIFAKIILGRVSAKLDENQPMEQAGFRRNFSTIDHIHTLKQLIEKYNEFNKTLYVAFIDYAKAFDCISHKAMWESLGKQGIPETYLDIIKNIYANSKAKIQLETLGKEFRIKRGVRQGDPMSPKLFSAVLENVFRNLDWEHLGLNIDGRKLNHLRFADDIVLLEENPKALEKMIQALNTESSKVGLKMNITKTKLMTNSEIRPIEIDGQKVEYVDEYCYLGQIISPKDQTTKEINKRIANGWKKYWSLKEVVKAKEHNMATKRKVFNTCILPCITYGCETWSLTKHHREKLGKCQRGMERSMTGTRRQDRVSNVQLREKTKLTDILEKIDLQKWRWTGHMLRSRQEKWSQIITNWYPRDGKRCRGRQQMRWENELKLTAGPKWRRVAQDRKQWRLLEEAFARRHTELRDIL